MYYSPNSWKCWCEQSSEKWGWWGVFFWCLMDIKLLVRQRAVRCLLYWCTCGMKNSCLVFSVLSVSQVFSGLFGQERQGRCRITVGRDLWRSPVPGHTWITGGLLCAIKIPLDTSTENPFFPHICSRFPTFHFRWCRKPGAGCPGRSWSVPLWRHSLWTSLCVSCSRWPCSGRGLDCMISRGPSWPQQFWDSVILLPFHFKMNTWLQKLRSEFECQVLRCCFGSSAALEVRGDQQSGLRRAPEIRNCNSCWKCLQKHWQMFSMNSCGSWKICCNKILGVSQGGGEMKAKISMSSCPQRGTAGTEGRNEQSLTMCC